MKLAEKLGKVLSNSAKSVTLSVQLKDRVSLAVEEDPRKPRSVRVSVATEGVLRTFTHEISSPWDYGTALDEVETVFYLNAEGDSALTEEMKKALLKGITSSLAVKFGEY